MSRDVRFALVREPLNPHATPEVKPTLAALARAIHFARNGAPIVLAPAPLKVREWDEELQGVSVHTLGLDGGAHRYVGWAWLDGFDWQTLQRALDSQVSTTPTLGGRAA
jgi:hypothetical protein